MTNLNNVTPFIEATVKELRKHANISEDDKLTEATTLFLQKQNEELLMPLVQFYKWLNSHLSYEYEGVLKLNTALIHTIENTPPPASQWKDIITYCHNLNASAAMANTMLCLHSNEECNSETLSIWATLAVSCFQYKYFSKKPTPQQVIDLYRNMRNKFIELLNTLPEEAQKAA